MADNNNIPEYVEPINDAPPKEEEVVTKPCNDDVDAPTPQLLSNYSQSQSENNDFPSHDNYQQREQTIPSEVPYYSPQANNNYNYYSNQNANNNMQIVPVRRRVSILKNPTCLIILSILLILIVIADVVLEIIFQFFNAFILADDIAILAMAITYLTLISKGRPTNHRALGVVTVLVWFIGFGAKGFGMSQVLKEKGKFTFNFAVTLFVLIGLRLFVMFICIPQTC